MNRPWEPMGFTTADWLRVPLIMLPLIELIPTQDVIPELLQGPDTSYCGDKYPHIVKWEGKTFINDGHHRIARAIRRAQAHARAIVRMVEINA